MLVTSCKCLKAGDFGDILWMLVPDAYVKNKWLLVTEMARNDP